jgi:hypothetical protein
MKIIVATLVALLIGITVLSSEAEARCWWNGYNHCRYYLHATTIRAGIITVITTTVIGIAEAGPERYSGANGIA